VRWKLPDTAAEGVKCREHFQLCDSPNCISSADFMRLVREGHLLHLEP
jgi:hypothetical protein